MSYKFKQNPLPSRKYTIKAPYSMAPQYITVHNTANDASAGNEIKYMITNNNQVSYHVAVDDKEVMQAIPFNRNAWHCGDGQGNGNRKSIGIEICYSKSGGARYAAAEENTVQYIAKLLNEFGWGIERVKKHQDWNGKYCPHRILSEGRWNSFLKRIEEAMKPKNTVRQKEETKVSIWNPGSPAMKIETENFIAQAVKDGIIQESHLKDLQNGVMTTDRLIGLYITIQQRRSK
ncbi:N-acetylmuramoyl-L-alanine amidase family protein [Lysinibacillus mangiferihumi]|uniref:N-acetylmuramoyl-L-alanine amidase n=1 Tax=Lysinibacillus mangiferihumi TaxID=1130819 RepID=A0A4U2Z7U0_9BACI|nr:N-acetylmuramoyl-L-alanine amidase family protein [Lysinibacillus mangiferihumi]TKI70104.1 N-acetylmuramoyl-L-alanine amidase family protein [Lysinibacillus mangiferihumi]